MIERLGLNEARAKYSKIYPLLEPWIYKTDKNGKPDGGILMAIWTQRIKYAGRVVHTGGAGTDEPVRVEERWLDENFLPEAVKHLDTPSRNPFLAAVIRLIIMENVNGA